MVSARAIAAESERREALASRDVARRSRPRRWRAPASPRPSAEPREPSRETRESRPRPGPHAAGAVSGAGMPSVVHGCGGTHYPSPCELRSTRCPELSALYPLVEVLYHRPARDDQHAIDLDAGARARPAQHAQQPVAQHSARSGARGNDGRPLWHVVPMKLASGKPVTTRHP